VSSAVLRAALRPVLYRTLGLPARLRAGLGLHRAQPPVAFVIERAEWAIRWVGEHVCREIEAIEPGLAATVLEPHRLSSQIVHFGSQFMWVPWSGALTRSNRYVTSYYHGKPEDGPEIARHVEGFLRSLPRLARIVVSASLVERRLAAWGVPPEKMVRIPIGTDLRIFVPPTPAEREAARASLGIPEGAIAIGSFQKDGVGWGDGMEPKPIKGPDIFLETLARLKRELPVFAIVTGPARGYVKAGLERRGIPYAHRYAKDHAALVACYHALDLYLVTSREEGGPMGLMESMATHVPVVSTPVGMAPDLLVDCVTGGLAASCEPEEVAARALALLSHPDPAALRAAAREAVKVADWPRVGRAHLEQVYRPLL
jgi:glycosyltransferase involved in cell wall biosynthesis